MSHLSARILPLSQHNVSSLGTGGSKSVETAVHGKTRLSAVLLIEMLLVRNPAYFPINSEAVLYIFFKRTWQISPKLALHAAITRAKLADAMDQVHGIRSLN
jgi:hypothetical protein